LIVRFLSKIQIREAREDQHLGRQLAPEVALCTQGTRGDIIPFVILAELLVRAGRRVTVMANSNWRSLAVGVGAEFHAICPPDPTQSGRNDKAFFKRHIAPSYRSTFDAVADLVATGRYPTVLYRSNMAGAAAAAEVFGLVAGCIYLQPFAVHTERLKSTALHQAVSVLRWTNLITRRIDAFRREVGLRGLNYGGSLAGHFSLVLCPDWFALPKADWPQNCYVIGFLLSECRGGTSPALADFLNEHQKPLLFTPGTGNSAVDQFISQAVECARRLDLPAVIVTPHARSYSPLPDRIAHVDFVEFAGLLCRCRAVVHHGGIGTTAHALAAGIPQMIVPDRFDQPDNGLRVAQLGLGGVVLKKGARAKDWVEPLKRILASSHIKMQVSTASAMIAESDPASVALAIIDLHERTGR
jgi:rhamnosyltransferase subunit B